MNEGGVFCPGPDGFSYEGSLGELRSACMEDFPPGLDFNSYTETLSDTHGVFQDSPPGFVVWEGH